MVADVQIDFTCIHEGDDVLQMHFLVRRLQAPRGFVQDCVRPMRELLNAIALIAFLMVVLKSIQSIIESHIVGWELQIWILSQDIRIIERQLLKSCVGID